MEFSGTDPRLGFSLLEARSGQNKYLLLLLLLLPSPFLSASFVLTHSSFTYSLTYSFIYSCIHSSTHTHLFTHSLTYSFIHSYAFIHSLTYSLTHSFPIYFNTSESFSLHPIHFPFSSSTLFSLLLLEVFWEDFEHAQHT